MNVAVFHGCRVVKLVLVSWAAAHLKRSPACPACYIFFYTISSLSLYVGSVEMHILVIGGTLFTGPHVVRGLLEQGYRVTLFHRGQTHANLPPQVTRIFGDRTNLATHLSAFIRLAPDVVIDMIALTRQDAQGLMHVFNGITGRVVVPSSIDVYRAFGRLHRTEPGLPDPVPLLEAAPLREQLSLHGEEYEKRWVEDEVLSHPVLPGTVVRLPAVYGAGDYRPWDYLKRMDDGRPYILLDERKARWRFSRGNVKNVAHALVLAATNERAKHRIYNVADEHAPTQYEWAQLIGQAAGWSGQIITLPPEQLPQHLHEHIDWQQDWVVDTGRIRQELGYTDIESPLDGVRAAVTWQRANPPDLSDTARFNYGAEDEIINRLTG